MTTKFSSLVRDAQKIEAKLEVVETRILLLDENLESVLGSLPKSPCLSASGNRTPRPLLPLLQPPPPPQAPPGQRCLRHPPRDPPGPSAKPNDIIAEALRGGLSQIYYL